MILVSYEIKIVIFRLILLSLVLYMSNSHSKVVIEESSVIYEEKIMSKVQSITSVLGQDEINFPRDFPVPRPEL